MTMTHWGNGICEDCGDASKGRAHRCPKCDTVYKSRWDAANYAANKEEIRKGQNSSRFAKLVVRAGRSPGNECEICLRPFSGRGPNFDHNHSTGEFRGWLCDCCNRGIGLLQDSPVIASAASFYLTERGHA